MLDKTINNKDLDKYLASFDCGSMIFHEGDHSQDLYILVSGQIEIFKGNNKLTELTEKGSFFGEMSFLLGQERTATAKTKTTVQTIRVPKEEITTFLHDFPELAGEMTKLLAKRLDETSQTLYRLKEFCDQLPDAVVATDREGKIITWNTAAEELYGQAWNRMKSRSVEEIYDDPKAFKKFFDEVRAKRSVREKILSIRHPQKGLRFISTSTSLLFDDYRQFHGILSLGRDVTAAHQMGKKYKRAYFWFFLLAIVSALLALVISRDYPSLSKKIEFFQDADRLLEAQINQDYMSLGEQFVEPMLRKDKAAAVRVMDAFFRTQSDIGPLYTGMVLLDNDQDIFAFYGLSENHPGRQMDENSYDGIDLSSERGRTYRVMTLYRSDQDHPTGKKSVEIAFRLKQGDLFIGWLIFHLDSHVLADQYGMDGSALTSFQLQNAEQ